MGITFGEFEPTGNKVSKESWPNFQPVGLTARREDQVFIVKKNGILFCEKSDYL
jgi:hypothetical protein